MQKSSGFQNSGMATDPALTEYLAGFLLPERRARLRDVLARRTNHVTVVLEDIFDPHNASAVLRSCEAMGIQTVHIIQMRHKFQVKEGVSMGTGKWLTLVHHSSTESCFEALRSLGYQICAASPPLPDSRPLPDYKAVQKTAVVLGSEKDGLSDFARKNADILLTIPMRGFAESFNLSVSAAVVVYALRESTSCPPLSAEEAADLEQAWICASLRNAPDLIERFKHPDPAAPRT